MPLPFKIHLVNNRTGAEDIVDGAFTDDEWNLLSRFVEYAGELEDAVILKRNPAWSFGLQYKDGKLTVDTLPPKSEIRELAHVLRPFILEEEPTFFYKIVRILRERVSHPRMDILYRAWSKRFSGKDSEEVVRISAGDTVINSEKTLKVWLNAYQYHRDEDKRALISELHQEVPLEVSEAVFVDLLLGKADAVLLATRFIRDIAAAPSARRNAPSQEG